MSGKRKDPDLLSQLSRQFGEADEVAVWVWLWGSKKQGSRGFSDGKFTDEGIIHLGCGGTGGWFLKTWRRLSESWPQAISGKIGSVLWLDNAMKLKECPESWMVGFLPASLRSLFAAIYVLYWGKMDT
jgi:hypothetical protein